MAIQTKPLDRVVSRWQTKASAATPDYVAGVSAAGTTQADHAAAAETTWGAGVQAALSNHTFVKGVQRDPGKWARNALSKGKDRFVGGINAAKDDFSKGIGPVLQVIAGVTLPPRQPRGSPSNNDRVAAITTALRAFKLSR